ncbi:hypothetical protein [Streptomyces qinglanensis]|uniref:hypothetical protein n=1 Tax=Streptomyces qinglanensis TaxID=943816 RepID=UPI001EF905C0|nr:hypothetical protein [Streptomyces qinglanensis]
MTRPTAARSAARIGAAETPGLDGVAACALPAPTKAKAATTAHTAPRMFIAHCPFTEMP